MSIYGNPVMLGGSGGGGGDIPWNDNFSVNWDFTNPVNTRGQSSYSSSNLIYSLDGWQLQGGTLDIESGGIRLTCYTSGSAGYFMQRYSSAWTSAFVGIPMVVSAVVDNTLGSFATTMTSGSGAKGGTWIGGVSIRIYNYGTEIAMTIDIGADTQTHLLKGIKLEVGSVSTLARDVGGVLVFNKTMIANEELIKVASGMVKDS